MCLSRAVAQCWDSLSPQICDELGVKRPSSIKVFSGKSKSALRARAGACWGVGRPWVPRGPGGKLGARVFGSSPDGAGLVTANGAES